MKQLIPHRVFSVALLLFAFFCPNAIVLPQEKSPSPDEKHRAEELWEKVIAAKGGREKLYAVKTLVVSTNSYNPADKKDFRNTHLVDLYVLPDRWWSWMDQRPGFSLGIRQFDFGKGQGWEAVEGSNRLHDWSVTPSRNVMGDLEQHDNIYDHRDFFLEKQLTYLMETKSFRPSVDRLGSEQSDGKIFEVIEVSFGREKLDYFIDPKTYLPNRIRIRTWIEPTKRYYMDGYFLEDYVDVAGVKFPQIIRRDKKTETKTTYQVNVEYDKNLFDYAPSIALGPDAWKPKP